MNPVLVEEILNGMECNLQWWKNSEPAAFPAFTTRNMLIDFLNIYVTTGKE